MRVVLSNLGCKLNQAEVDRIARELAAWGHRIVSDLADADLHIVNSCTVTHRAARDSRKTARRGARLHDAVRTVLTGCWVSEDPERAARLAGVDLVVPNAEKHELVDRLRSAFPDLWRTAASEAETTRASVGGMGADAVPVPWVPMELGRARGLVKIEDGCNMRCAFCIIPSTRGRQVSRRPEAVVEEVEALAEAGVPEIVVTGVQISEYRFEGLRLAGLLDRLLGAVASTSTRLRITSIAPWRFDDRLLGQLKDDGLCRHLHLSLQSGARRTLREMRRPYTPGRYRELLGRIREAVPGIGLTTDVIVGFPGETEDEHRESLEFVRTCAFAGVHVFSYSPRPGTEAAKRDDGVDPGTIRRRTHEMIAVAEASAAEFRESQVGETLDVVWEERHRGRWRGVTDNYVRVWCEAGESPPRRGPARLVERTGGMLRAEPVGVAQRSALRVLA